MRIRRELQRLAESVAGVKVRTSRLDPWLRAHLYAQRLEELYAEFRDLAGKSEAGSGPGGETEAARAARGATDEGPYLGQQGKYCVMLCEREATLGQYVGQFIGPHDGRPREHLFPRSGSLFIGTAAQLFGTNADDDAVLHAHLIHHVTKLLVKGLRHYDHRVAGWIEQGLAHWFRRRVYPQQHCFDAAPADLPLGPRAHDWEAKVRARVEQGCATAAEQLLAWPPGQPATYVEHVESWSRIDFLARSGKLGTFLRGGKGPGFGRAGQSVEAEAAARPRRVLLHDCSLTPEQLDQEWRRFVLATYGKR